MEFVYVVKRYELFERSFPHGFVAARDDARVAQWVERIRARGFFVERRHAENDSTLKQIIPYTLVTHGDEVLLLERLSRGGETRLHGKRSVGVGGHINPIDGVSAEDVLEAGARRELDEELALDTRYALSPVGVINDESDDVGSVHFGLVHVARCETRDVAIRETDVLAGTFVRRAALSELGADPESRLETWSRLIVARLDAVLA